MFLHHQEDFSCHDKKHLFLNRRHPRIFQSLPLALQHVVAMIVGCVTPAILISDVAGLNERDRVILVQARLYLYLLSVPSL